MTRQPKILVLRGGALGDFILTLPAIAALRGHWPKAYIELVGHAESARLALTTGLINRLQSLDSARMASFFQKGENLPPEEQKYIGSFDLIVCYLHDPDGILLQHLKEAGAENIVSVSPLVKSGHAAEHFFNPLRHILRTADGECPPARLEWPKDRLQEALLQLQKLTGGRKAIMVHPGSGSPAKNWPAEKFAMLAKKIRTEMPFEALIIGGEADAKAISSLRSLLPDFHFLNNLPLMEVASLLSVAAGFVGNDSGITHLAAALGIPVGALFGPTDPAIWAPRGKNVAIIKNCFRSAGSLAEIEVDAVFRMLIGQMQCKQEGIALQHARSF